MAHEVKTRRRKPVREPQTAEEWQLVVDAAYALLALDSARQYGLVKGGPGVAIDRAVELLDRGKLLGYLPSADSIERLVAGLMPK